MRDDQHWITAVRRTPLNQARVTAPNRIPDLARLGLLALGLVIPSPDPAAEKPPEQERNQSQVFPQGRMERALRYHPDRGDSIITNGVESFNRPLYAAIWASDDLQYHGGGAIHASACNYRHHAMAARVARLIGEHPAPYEKEADLIRRGMQRELWLPQQGWFGEFKDYLGQQAVHPSPAVW